MRSACARVRASARMCADECASIHPSVCARASTRVRSCGRVCIRGCEAGGGGGGRHACVGICVCAPIQQFEI